MLRPLVIGSGMLLSLAVFAGFDTQPAWGQNGIVVPSLLGGDLTNPEDDFFANASLFSGGSSPPGEDSTRIIDNSTGTKWLSFSPDGTFLQIRLNDGASSL
ncbi:MAG: hypothetical protein AAGJ46_04465, partial [Planctomycetota bacterium]